MNYIPSFTKKKKEITGGTINSTPINWSKQNITSQPAAVPAWQNQVNKIKAANPAPATTSSFAPSTPFSQGSQIGTPINWSKQNTSSSYSQPALPQAPKYQVEEQQAPTNPFTQAINNFKPYQTNSDTNFTNSQNFFMNNQATNEKNLKDMYDQNAKGLNDQIPFFQKQAKTAQSEFDNYVTNVDTQATTNINDISAEADQGLSQLARNKKREDAQRMATFAALGTLESGGQQGFTGQQSQGDESYLGNVADVNQGKVRAITQIKTQAAGAKQAAKTEVENKIANFENQIATIKNSVSMNDIQKTQAVQALWSQTQKDLMDLAAKHDEQQAGFVKAISDIQLKEAESNGKSNKGDLATATALRQQHYEKTKANNYLDLVSTFDKLKKDASNPTPVGDQALIYGIMKMFDPNSTVREGEAASIQRATSLGGVIGQAAQQAVSGQKLTQDQRNNIVSIAENYYNTAQAQQDKIDEYYGELANRAGIDPYEVTGFSQSINPNKQSNQNSFNIGEFQVQVLN